MGPARRKNLTANYLKETTAIRRLQEGLYHRRGMHIAFVRQHRIDATEAQFPDLNCDWKRQGRRGAAHIPDCGRKDLCRLSLNMDSQSDNILAAAYARSSKQKDGLQIKSFEVVLFIDEVETERGVYQGPH